MKKGKLYKQMDKILNEEQGVARFILVGNNQTCLMENIDNDKDVVDDNSVIWVKYDELINLENKYLTNQELLRKRDKSQVATIEKLNTDIEFSKKRDKDQERIITSLKRIILSVQVKLEVFEKLFRTEKNNICKLLEPK